MLIYPRYVVSLMSSTADAISRTCEKSSVVFNTVGVAANILRVLFVLVVELVFVTGVNVELEIILAAASMSTELVYY